jgi:hypothetical protein
MTFEIRQLVELEEALKYRGAKHFEQTVSFVYAEQPMIPLG